MQRSSPLLSRGFRRLEASITPPEAAPAPMMVWISSMNRTALSRAWRSERTLFRRFSKSPRYFVPASKAPRSSEYTSLPLTISGTCPSTMRLARPSAMAVLPTPASPTRRGLFLRRRVRICTTRSTSSSRPTRGSIRPALACSFKLLAKASRAPAPAGSAFSWASSVSSCASPSPSLSWILEIP